MGPLLFSQQAPDTVADPPVRPHSAARPRAGRCPSETAVNSGGREAIALVPPHPLPGAVPEPPSAMASAPPDLSHPLPLRIRAPGAGSGAADAVRPHLRSPAPASSKSTEDEDRSSETPTAVVCS